MTGAGTGRRGRPPVLSHEAIARAVLEVGFRGLTFAAVRERLGVGQTTLFRYARDRDELVRLGLDYAIGQADWPPLTGPWRSVLEAYALTVWRIWESHPGSATEVARGIFPRGAMRLTVDLCALLIRQGFTPDNAVLACDIVFDLVTDNRRGVEHIDGIVGSDPGTSREHLHQMWSSQTGSSAPGPEGAEHGVGSAEQAAVYASMRAAIAASPLDWFTRKLHIALDGIEHSLAPVAAGH